MTGIYITNRVRYWHPIRRGLNQARKYLAFVAWTAISAAGGAIWAHAYWN